jgi:hypothetical protein
MQDIIEEHKVSNYNEETNEWEESLVSDEFKYNINLPITSLNLIDHFTFPNNEDLFDFFYIDFAMEIFGNSQSKTKDSFKILNDLYKNLRDDNEISIISDEIEKSKPATLFFLSKNGCLIERINFFSTVTIEKLWEEYDVIVTANPNILDNSKNNTIIIKYNTTYNSKNKSDYDINDISEVNDIISNLN